MKGYTSAEIIGQHFSIFYPPEDMAWNKPAYELEIATERGSFEDEGWRIRKDGTRFWSNVLITAVRDENGDVLGFSKVTRDLTERRAAEQRAIDDARRVTQAETANKTKSEFLASMSHELRTPLNAIGGYADLLLAGVTGELSATQSGYLERLRRSQHHLLAIITDLLNFSRIEAGRLTYDMSSMSVGDAVRRVLPMIEPQATQRGLALKVKETADHVVVGDSSKVEQVLLNLLSNAIKFTPPGGSITIEQFGDAERAGVRITDSGVGIEASQIESIFEPFVQVGRSLTTTQEGTGLGLAISRELARAMHGDLKAASAIGVGSTFELSLKSGA
jgi:PAS domain S-box-containing protein